jgi:hypothetical protein
MVPTNRPTSGSASAVRIWPISVKATRVPATGVQSPGMSSIPEPAWSAADIVLCIGGAPDRFELARRTRTAPTTRRMSSRPAPGQPPANVEYSRRTTCPCSSSLILGEPNRNPPKGRGRDSSGSLARGGAEARTSTPVESGRAAGHPRAEPELVDPEAADARLQGAGRDGVPTAQPAFGWRGHPVGDRRGLFRAGAADPSGCGANRGAAGRCRGGERLLAATAL